MDSIARYALGIFDKMPTGVPLLAYLAGGCFRSFYDGTPVKDYDLFFKSEADWRWACAWFRVAPDFVELTKPGEGMYPSFQRGNEPPFNLIGFRYHNSIEDLAASFDFTCCAIAGELVEPDVVVIHHQPRAREDAVGRILSIQNHQHIDRVEKRRRRYVDQYGYMEDLIFPADLVVCASLPRSSGHGGGGY